MAFFNLYYFLRHPEEKCVSGGVVSGSKIVLYFLGETQQEREYNLKSCSNPSFPSKVLLGRNMYSIMYGHFNVDKMVFRPVDLRHENYIPVVFVCL